MENEFEMEKKSEDEIELFQRVANRMTGMGFTEDQLNFIFADWNNTNDHYQWLLTASRDEIAEWIAAGK